MKLFKKNLIILFLSLVSLFYTKNSNAGIFWNHPIYTGTRIWAGISNCEKFEDLLNNYRLISDNDLAHTDREGETGFQQQDHLQKIKCTAIYVKKNIWSRAKVVALFVTEDDWTLRSGQVQQDHRVIGLGDARPYTISSYSSENPVSMYVNFEFQQWYAYMYLAMHGLTGYYDAFERPSNRDPDIPTPDHSSEIILDREIARAVEVYIEEKRLGSAFVVDYFLPRTMWRQWSDAYQTAVHECELWLSGLR